MRKPEALHQVYICGDRSGTKPLNLVAEDFLSCAEQNRHLYVPPKVNTYIKSFIKTRPYILFCMLILLRS